MNRVPALLLSAALVVALAPVGAGAAEPVHTDNLAHVTNLRFDERPDLGQSLRLATDVDFHTYELDGEARDFAFVGTQVNGLQVVDITDPHAPEVVAVYECAIAQGDVFLFERTDLGKVFVAYTSDIISGQTNWQSRCHQDNGVRAGQYGTFLVDVTDPHDPRSVSFIRLSRGTHQVAVHPGNDWLYSAPSNRQPNTGTPSLGQIDIVDISDPYDPGEPEAVEWLTGFDGHDLSFSAAGDRAYVAAISHTVILDTSDPGAPVFISSIADPTIETHHDAYAYTADAGFGERTYLFITDELLGAAGNGYCPGGGLHVYDITGELEQAPVKVGTFFAPTTNVQEGGRGGIGGLVRCTAHVPQIHAEAELMTIAWFGAGVRVLDLSGLVGVNAGAEATGGVGTGIEEIGFFRFPDSDVWAAKTNRIADDGAFYLYGIDTVRQFDVFRFDPGAEEATGAGEWVPAGAPLPRAGATSAPYCAIA